MDGEETALLIPTASGETEEVSLSVFEGEASSEKEGASLTEGVSLVEGDSEFELVEDGEAPIEREGVTLVERDSEFELVEDGEAPMEIDGVSLVEGVPVSELVEDGDAPVSEELHFELAVGGTLSLAHNLIRPGLPPTLLTATTNSEPNSWPGELVTRPQPFVSWNEEHSQTPPFLVQRAM